MNSRTWLSFALLGGILLFGLVGAMVLYGYVLAPPNLINLGAVTNYPPGETPYFVPGKNPVFVVNTGENLLVLVAVPPHPKACLAKWLSEDAKFMDPCLGSQFWLDGTYILGPSPRNMDHYKFRIENGELWMDADRKILGEQHP